MLKKNRERISKLEHMLYLLRDEINELKNEIENTRILVSLGLDTEYNEYISSNKAIKLILEHLNLEIVENKQNPKFKLIEKEENSKEV